MYSPKIKLGLSLEELFFQLRDRREGSYFVKYAVVLHDILIVHYDIVPARISDFGNVCSTRPKEPAIKTRTRLPNRYWTKQWDFYKISVPRIRMSSLFSTLLMLLEDRNYTLSCIVFRPDQIDCPGADFYTGSGNRMTQSWTDLNTVRMTPDRNTPDRFTPDRFTPDRNDAWADERRKFSVISQKSGISYFQDSSVLRRRLRCLMKSAQLYSRPRNWIDWGISIWQDLVSL